MDLEIFTNISEADKQLLLQNGCVIKTKLIILHVGDEEPITLTEQNSIKTWEHTTERIVPDEGFIGQFVARTLTGELQNISDDFNIEDRDIELQIGIALMNGGTLTNESWYTLGGFKVMKPEDDEVSDNTTFEAMDYTVLFNKQFNPDFINNDFPVSFNQTLANGGYFTAKQLAQYTCAQVSNGNISIPFATTTFNNEDFQITSNQFTKSNSCRDVLKAIAQLAYGWAEVKMDNKCYITTPVIDYTNIETTLTNDNYYDLTVQKTPYGPVNIVYVGLKTMEGEGLTTNPDMASISTYGETQLEVYDNPITNTQPLRQQALRGATNLYGLTYTPFECETPGHPWLTAETPIKISNMEGLEYTTYPFTNIISYTGHIKTTLSADAQTSTEKGVGYKQDVLQDLKDVHYIIDKQEGTITQVVSDTKANADKITGVTNSVTQLQTSTYTKTEIKQIVSNVDNETGLVVSNVTNTSGTFANDGLTIEQTGATTDLKLGFLGTAGTTDRREGLIVNSAQGGSQKELLFAGYDGSVNGGSTIVRTDNINVRTYLNIGTYSRIEDYQNGTGIFFL